MVSLAPHPAECPNDHRSAPPDRLGSGLVLAGAAWLQGAILIAWVGAGTAVGLAGAAALAAAALGALALWRRPGRSSALDMILVTGCVGGLGMLLGGGLDAWAAPAAVPHCHAPAGQEGLAGGPGGWSLAALWTWMNGLMLLSCVPACALLCGPCGRRSALGRVGAHAGCALGMMIGMFVGGALLGEPLRQALGAGVAAGHLAMLIGMVVGVGATAWLIQRLPAVNLLPRAAARA